jgi:hypothetical protein
MPHILAYDPSNAVWAGPVSARQWVPLSAYAADGKPAACSKGHAVQWVWGIVRWGRGDFIRTRYRQRRFSIALQEIWRNDDMSWHINEDARVDR